MRPDRSAAMRASGWRCLSCGAIRDIAEPFPWRCPNATISDRHHVLQIAESTEWTPRDDRTGRDPADGPAASLQRHDRDLAWAAYAAANGVDHTARAALVAEVDRAVAAVAGVGFHTTPYSRSDALSDALGFTPAGGVWVKDETHAVGGSQKARHLVTILLHLRAAEVIGHLPERPSLAIASCGNAALAAATLARAADWPIDVYVPTWMDDAFGRELDRLGALVHRCERRSSDPAGDPAMHRFRDAVERGAIPFTVQGPENALALDGGRTIGWEIGEQHTALRREGSVEGPLDRVLVQVGGGAFAACLGAGLRDLSPTTRLHAVQAAGCAPLERAWVASGAHPDADLASLAASWSSLMYPWTDPRSAADGILDDETYDWLGVFDALARTHGEPIVAAEAHVLEAHRLATDAGFEVSVTGSAGLAGLIAARRMPATSPAGGVGPTERVAVVMSGVRR